MQRMFEAGYRSAYDNAVAKGSNAAVADGLAKAAACEAAGSMLLPEDFEQIRDNLVALGREYGLYAPNLYPNRDMPQNERARMYGQIWYDLRFLRGVYNAVDYPFELQPGIQMSPEEFALGEALVKELQCFK
jgi:hypothetical protein